MRIETSLFRDSVLLEQVEDTLGEISSDLTPEVICELSEALESLDKRVSDLNNSGFKGRIQTAKNQLINREISVILDRARDLEHSVFSSNAAEIAAKVDALKNSLELFENLHGKEYSFIQEAKAFINAAIEVVEKPRNEALKVQLEQSFEALSELLSARLGQDIPPEEAELIFELFELAEAVHHKKEVKEQLLDLKARLKSSQAEKIDQSQGDDEQLKTVLLEVGHELAGKRFTGDTEEWFRELDQFSETPNFVSHNSDTIKA